MLAAARPRRAAPATARQHWVGCAREAAHLKRMSTLHDSLADSDRCSARWSVLEAAALVERSKALAHRADC